VRRFDIRYQCQWSGFDIRDLPGREFGKRMSNRHAVATIESRDPKGSRADGRYGIDDDDEKLKRRFARLRIRF
jgi:hypothetical protein